MKRLSTSALGFGLVFTLATSDLTPPLLARGSAAEQQRREAAQRKAAGQNEAARRAAAARAQAQSRARQRNASPSTPSRNPLTGSAVNRPSRPNPAANRPAANRPAANRPAAPKGRPANPATRPAAPKGPANPATRPAAPKGPANNANRPAAPKGPANTANRPAAPKGPANTANRPAAPKGPANTANRPPAPKGPVNAANRPKQKGPASRPNPNLGNRPTPRPGAVAGRPPRAPASSNRKPFVPGKVTYPKRIANNANRRPPAPKRPSHPAITSNRRPPRSAGQVIANTNVNSGNRVNNTNIANTSNRVSNTSNRINNIGNTSNQVTNISNTTNNNISNNWGNQWNTNQTTIWNNNRVVNNRPVVVNRNFERSVNYAYRPSSWGSRPWWSNSTYHSWHQGSWNYGWNRNWQRRHHHRPPVYYAPPGYHHHHHHDSGIGSSAAWGIAAWSLGRLAFDSGYNTYRNPYQAPPVRTQTTVINYTQPISVAAAKEREPQSEEVALSAQEKSSAATARARDAFRGGDYLAALQATDESISYAPGDSALHEFRALCLFALGRYGDAAGVLNPLLASGPGWDWATMSDFYADGEIYTGQLRKLEGYVESKPDSADSSFLLGYHYMVAGFIDEAYAMFNRVAELQPADTVAAQLRDLARSSSPNLAEEDEETITGTPEALAAEEEVLVEPLDPVDLEGSWKAASGDGKAINLSLDPEGKFTWTYEGAEDGKVLAGDWSIDEEGQLVLASDDAQMVADVSLDGDTMQFVLAGGPVDDPGLSFSRP